ncbi:hypothetical protein P691DRAFT_852177 [Macrolepiota fuliginosa MF-IS2]|uniref:Uncharacterized protein n=1 Tax=Macrolepiota fuliginosa MF-IS2 TaxID=1400762 RepID=A0A9P6BXH5_9AGAR|nr:hypothetical protein P691DRAFT_852177 [Macrolepiota fuliginosa MF-IS2]
MRLGLGRTHFLCIYLFSILFFPAKPALVNVTVDDSGQDPVTNRTIAYGPGWHAGQDCDICFITTISGFDPGQTYQRSWHDGSFAQTNALPLFATFSFYGSAIYVFGILAKNDGPWPTTLDVQFYIDGRLSDTFDQPLPAQHTYNVSLFSINDLTNSEHVLVMFNGELGKSTSLALIDYLVYSYDPENATSIGIAASTPPKVLPLPMGAIVGGAIGGALTLILLFVSVFFCLRHCQQVRKLTERLLPSHSTTVTPFSRASSGLDPSAKSRPRRTQDVVEPPPYTAEESLTGVTLPSRTWIE